MVRVTPQGAMSEYLRDRAAVGDTIEFTGPYGSFFLREPKRPLLLLAGGTGLAPLLSILEKLSENPPSTPVHLIYGVTREADIVGLDWLRAYEAKLPTFTWDYIASEPGHFRPAHGLRHADHRTVAPQRWRRGYLPLRTAPHGQCRLQVAGHRGHPARQLLFRAFRPEGNHRRGRRNGRARPLRRRWKAEGDTISRGEAISSMETGRLEFRKEDSFAQLDARMGLELAVTELMLDRLSKEQLHQFRRLAEATTRPWTPEGSLTRKSSHGPTRSSTSTCS